MTDRWTVRTETPEETQALGEALGRVLQGGDVLLLSGPLGAGKTTFTQGIARGMDVNAYTKSPTFVLVNEYRQGRLPLYHMDLYRVETPEEAWDLGIDDYLGGAGVLVVEWAERAVTAFPADHLLVTLTPRSPTTRELAFASQGPRGAAALARLKERWLGATGDRGHE